MRRLLPIVPLLLAAGCEDPGVGAPGGGEVDAGVGEGEGEGGADAADTGPEPGAFG